MRTLASCKKSRLIHSLMVSLVFFVTMTAGAATFTVTNTSDAGPGSLRAAIQAANDSAGADEIVFDGVRGTIALTSGRLTIEDSVTVDGPGAEILTIDCQGTFRTFDVFAGIGVVHVAGLRLTGGPSDRHAIGNFGADVTISDSTLTDNAGGAIINFLGRLTVTSSTISGNGGSQGGALDIRGGTVQITDSTLSGNTVRSDGGAIFNDGSLSLTNSTVSGNNAAFEGGGISNEPGRSVTVTNSTLTDNNANQGGGIFNEGASVTLENSIIRNPAGGGDCFGAGAFISNGYNLDSDGSCDLTQPTDLSSIDPMLGPLADNGGSTFTHALLPGSPAIDRIPSGVNGCGTTITTDQRGVLRPIDGDRDAVLGCDIGAFEMNRLFVTNNNDAGAGSLREAIVTANTSPGLEEIVFDGVSGTISLTAGLGISDSLIIDGPGPSELAIDCAGNCRIFNVTAGPVTISGITLTGGNSYIGGAVYNLDSRLTLVDSVISGNSAGWGGGVYNHNGGVLEVRNSTISGNTSEKDGGGIFNNGYLTLINSTLSGNTASNAPGGAIYNVFYPVSVINSTITANSGVGVGGIVNSDAEFGSVTLSNSIVSDQLSGMDCGGAGSVTSNGYNLDSDGSCDLNQETDVPNTDPLLGPLADNGGPTPTHALLAGSVAIDYIPPTVNGCGTSVTTDQRGAARGVTGCDMGAFEVSKLLVTNTNDAGVGSLRDAIEIANKTPWPDEILFDAGVSGTVTLTTGGLVITDSLTIDGPGADALSIACADGCQIFRVEAGEVRIVGLKLTSVDSGGPFARGIYNNSILTLSDCTLFSLDGGVTNDTSGIMTVANSALYEQFLYAIRNKNELTLHNSTVTSVNDSYAILNESASLIVTDSSITANSVDGIVSTGSGSTLTVTNSTFEGNQGFAIVNSAGTLIVRSSTFLDNYDAGIFNRDVGTVTVINSTFTQSQLIESPRAVLNGALGLAPGPVTLTHTTINGSWESGIVNNGDVTLTNSLIAMQDGTGCAGTGVITSNGYNLASDVSCGLTQPTDLPNTDPLLEPLADNGGPTRTHALPANSPAIDHIPQGENGCGTSMITDQRGLIRPFDGNRDGVSGCDIGAYESNRQIIVRNKNDTGAGSLREAIEVANATPGLDEIVFNDVSGAIALESIGFTISDSLTISGPGAEALTLDCQGVCQVFDINAGEVRIDGLTLTGGSDTGYAISNLGADLELSNSTISFNDGGAIFNSGNLWVSNCDIWANIYTSPGPISALYSDSGTVTVTNSTIGGTYGFGIYMENENSTLIVTNSTLSGNYDAAIWNWGGTATVTSSIMMENVGGGIWNSDAGKVTVTNSIFNEMWYGIVNGQPYAQPPGNIPGDVSLVSSTISMLWGGGIFNSGGGDMTLTNSLVAAPGADCDGTGTVVSNGYNLDSDGTCGLDQATDLPNTDPLLEPSSRNPLEFTHVPLADSPVIDHIPAGANGCGDAINADQRGVPRPLDGDGDSVPACDIGAYEKSNYFVSNTNDSGPGSLRKAIADAHATSWEDDIVFGDVSGTIVLTSGALRINDSTRIRIYGPRPTSLAIDGGNNFSLFDIEAGELNIVDLTLRGGAGSAIRNRGGNVTVTGSTLSDNAGINGGAIYNVSSLTLLNTTLSGNSASNGGGIFNDTGGTLTATHATVTNNEGGGIFNKGSLTVASSIMANQATGADCDINAGTLSSTGYNLDSDGSCGLTGTGDLSNTNPLLGALADNGGGTFSHALLAGSPAIDAVRLFSNGCGNIITKDQRGVVRPQDGNGDEADSERCDMGAVEAIILHGLVTDASGSVGLVGATVTLDGHQATTTDGNGHYLFHNIGLGTHVLSPAYVDASFSPVSRTVNVSGAVLGGVNFIASGVSYMVSGDIADFFGAPIPGVRVLADTGESTSTDSNGHYVLRLPFGVRELTASLSGVTFGDNPRRINLNQDAESVFYGSDRPPIVMVHGIFDDSSIFAVEADRLRAAGYHVETPALETSIIYTPPVAVNAVRVKQAIDTAKSATGQPKVILIGHSMGGIVSRAYLESSMYEADVLALFTFGSPHLGVPFDVLTWLNPFSCLLQPCELSTGGMSSFNQSHQRRSGVQYHVVGGEVPARNVRFCFGIPFGDFCLGFWVTVEEYLTLKFPWNLLAGLSPEADDGFVQTDSALGLSGTIDRFRTDESHSPDHGFDPYFRRDAHLSRSFSECLQKVLIDKTGSTCGAVSSASTNARAGLSSLDAFLSQVAAEDTVQLDQRTPVESGIIRTGEIVAPTLILEGGFTSFMTDWNEGSVSVVLFDPTGQRIDPVYADDHPAQVIFNEVPNGVAYYLLDALPGEWQVELTGENDVPDVGTLYRTSAMFESALTLSVGTDQAIYHFGDMATIIANLAGALETAQVTATLIYSDGTEEVLDLVEIDDGEYQGVHPFANKPGYTQITVKAAGTKLDGAPFEREANQLVQLSSGFAQIVGHQETTEPRDTDPTLYEKLVIGVNVDVPDIGTTEAIGVSGDLVDGQGYLVAHGATTSVVGAGATEHTLKFAGDEIFASQKDGPYRLTNLVVTAPEQGYLVLLQVNDAYTTAAYNYRSFAPRQNAPTLSAGGPYTIAEGSSATLNAVGIDPDNDPLSYAWDLDDDGLFETPGQNPLFSAETLDGPQPRHVFAQVVDSTGHSAVDQTTLDVFNVAPTVSLGADVTIRSDEVFRQAGSFIDPGPDSWTATVDYDDGEGEQPLALSDKSFQLMYSYTEQGIYEVTVSVSDDDGGVGTESVIVTVMDFGEGDFDSDGILDMEDNCVLRPNGPDRPDAGGNSQLDADGDGYGNSCDPDFNSDLRVDFSDLAYMKSVFFTADPDADLNGDGRVDFADLATIKSMFFGPPGPSALAP